MARWWNIFGAAGNRNDKVMLVTDRGDNYTPWNGNLYKSDIVRSAIRPKVKAIGKLTPVHIREGTDGLKVNPELYIKRLLEEPNPYCSGQMFMERMITQLEMTCNAFALIYRDSDGIPLQLYQIIASNVEAIREEGKEIMLRFMLPRGKVLTVAYADVIHLRSDYNDHDIFGTSRSDALKSVMEIINSSDQSVVNAVKRSSVIKWILKFKSSLKKDDRDMQVKEFVDSYLDASKEGGAAYSDPRYDLEQVKTDTYVPATPQQEKAVQRIYSFFGTNDKIVQSRYTEDEWNAYFEAEIEPCAMQAAGEFTRKLFSPRERGHGNKIVFDSMDLSFASMATKLSLMQMVDRGALTANEWRRVLNLPPLEGGDQIVRRLDTAPVQSTAK
ncbi:phage portal protein [Paenibacillus sp. N4]|uniref:phage portal protein n=1 Tax=Paenibacillus vietnamensis TaxID=2590547 RepID=UPI001CD0EA95|nr:phage portal protein [Paenibacillus vietnamensis]MCA0754914.1 phage portal protein [Paenibacillus vietnamensis]